MNTPEEKEKIRAALSELYPFQHLPGNPPQDQIIEVLSSGYSITVAEVERVMNDAWLHDTLEGDGMYASPFEAYKIAVKMYGCAPINLYQTGCHHPRPHPSPPPPPSPSPRAAITPISPRPPRPLRLPKPPKDSKPPKAQKNGG